MIPPFWPAAMSWTTLPAVPIEEQLQLARSFTPAGIEVHLPHVGRAGLDRVKAALDRGPVPVIAATGLLPGAILHRQLDLAAVRRGLATLQAIRCPLALVTLDHRTPHSYYTAEKETARRLNVLAEVAADYRITLVVEALGTPSRHSPCHESGPVLGIRTLPQVDRLLDLVDGPVGVCADSMSWAATGADLRHLSRLRHRIRHVRLADIPQRVPVGAWGTPQRLLPGAGSLPWKSFAAGLMWSGYDGPLTITATNPRVRDLPPDQVAAATATAAKRVRRFLPPPSTSAEDLLAA